MKFSTKKVTKAALVAAIATSAFATSASADGHSFSDVPQTNVHYDNILNLSGRDIVSGYPDGTYRPANHLTRAEAAVILSNALMLDTTDYEDPEFSDLKEGAWYYDEVAALTELGILNGYGNGKFGPNDKLTRAQMASILTFAYNLYAPATTQIPFNDVPTTSWYFSFVQNLYFYDVTAGTTATTYSPNAFVRRDAMASFVVNAEEADTELKVDTALQVGVEDFNDQTRLPIKTSFDQDLNEVNVTVYNTDLQIKDIMDTNLFMMIPYYDLYSATVSGSSVELSEASPSEARAAIISALGLTEESDMNELAGKTLVFSLEDYWGNAFQYTFTFSGF
ncbi:S-layer homology domain-containing protein [Chryseomicrobium sp. FSL W7-1435]|uniref:S-layer homology domain-containing protein n=1 Tax=Chryseomicrobium sp. FSL W7-1435 TaxID=2921704 RepID=UPI00315AA166